MLESKQALEHTRAHYVQGLTNLENVTMPPDDYTRLKGLYTDKVQECEHKLKAFEKE
jgi:hypothetical protein